jgi:hypothetical protein
VANLERGEAANWFMGPRRLSWSRFYRVDVLNNFIEHSAFAQLPWLCHVIENEAFHSLLDKQQQPLPPQSIDK